MKFPRYLIEKLVPDRLPPDRFLAEVVNELAKSIKDQLLKRSYLWSIAVMNAGFVSRLELPPRLTNYSTGFVYITEENVKKHGWLTSAEGFSYGANILIESENALPQVVLPLKIDSFMFPVVVNFGFIEEHGLPTHPHTGTGTCWIQNQNQTRKWEKGILTCRHTVNSVPLSSAVNLHPSINHLTPIQGVLADITACTIDAAIIGIADSEWPQGLAPLQICNPVAPGQQVSFQGRITSGAGSVLHAFQHPTYFGNLYGQRLFTDCFGSQGDSGSLFIDPSVGKGLGVYMGSVPDGSGGREGLCQHLFQASRFFGFSTFL